MNSSPSKNTGYNYSSPRAQKARLGKKLNNIGVKILCILLGLSLIALGAFLVYLKSQWAWLCIGCGIFLFLPLYWIKHSLVELPKSKTPSLENELSRELLINLPKSFETFELLNIANSCTTSYFMCNRFNLFPTVIATLIADLNAQPADIFAKAMTIQQELNLPEIDGATLIVAAIELTPNIEQKLQKIKLDTKALRGGLSWYYYLENLLKESEKHHSTGGIGRDLSFGYSNLLQNYSYNISRSSLANPININIATHRENINQLINIFSGNNRQNAALIGAEGCGRATIVSAFANIIMSKNAPSSLRYRQVFKVDASSLIASAPGKGQLESLVTAILNEAYDAKNIILWFDNAELFFQDGTGAVDISNLLTPVLQGGNLRVILSMNQQQFLEIASRNPQLTNSVNRINVEPASEAETIAVMQDQTPFIEFRHNRAVITYWALQEAYRLSARYVQGLAMPGQALALLESAADYPIDGAITDTSVQMAVEKNYGVKMQSTQTQEEKKELLNLEEKIHERMIDQASAVTAVSNALRRAAAGVRNQNRPIGTFLFLGPTGVGKTELAKAISATYFHGEEQIVRIDLNEYVKEEDVTRLIDDPVNNENSLTAQISKRPFSVVLLDEIEKAHPKVLTTLLQLLDEGVLRDINNREISFRDAIIVATSNASAEHIREYIDQGQDLSTIKNHLTDELIHSGEFKPEFLNRFDEICVFEPLSPENLLKIVDLIINSVNSTLQPQNISVALDDEAKKLLVEKGYDPKLGARPMHRIIQNTVQNIVANKLLTGEINAGSVVNLTAQDLLSQLEV